MSEQQAQAPVTLGLNDLQTVMSVIDIASQRGAFKAGELAAVGVLYNKVSAFLEAAKAAQEAQAAEPPAAVSAEETPAAE